MLAQNVQPALTDGVIFKPAIAHRLKRRLAFEIFKAVGGQNTRLRCKIKAVPRAPDTLHKALNLFGRTNLDHQINIAPVDPQIETACADDCAQAALTHRGLDLSAGLARQRAVMDANRQGVLIGLPQFVEKQFGIGAGVVKDQRGAMAFNLVIDRLHAKSPAAPRPWGRDIRLKNGDIGRGALRRGNDLSPAVRRQIGRDLRGLFYCGGQTHTGHLGGQPRKPRETQHQLIAPFAVNQRMNFIENNPLHRGKNFIRLRIGQ